MTVDLSHDAMRSAVEDLHQAADRLAHDRARIGREVAFLLDGGWSGRAAETYAEAWSDWFSASADVLQGLRAMARLVAAFHRDVADRDLDAGSRLDALASRVIARLG